MSNKQMAWWCVGWIAFAIFGFPLILKFCGWYAQKVGL